MLPYLGVNHNIKGEWWYLHSTFDKIGLNKIKNKSNIFIAYEPVWAIGTGIVPKPKDLLETINFIKRAI